MKHYLITLLLTFSFLNIYAQDINWVSKINSQGYDECLDLVVSENGNVYAAGQIEFTTSFDGYMLSSAGIHDVFLARYDSSGQLIWARSAGGTDGDKAIAVAIDGNGNSFITGEFEETAYFDSFDIESEGSNNMFIAKYDSLGNVVWLRDVNTRSGSTRGYGIDCDADGNVYVAGIFQSRVYYNGSSLFNSYGEDDAILLKFDKDGNYKWARHIGGDEDDMANAVAVSGASVYVTGSYEGDIDFSSSSVSLSGGSSIDIFLAKYDTAGQIQWARNGGGSGDDDGRNLTINSNGNIVCTGGFIGTTTFGSHTIQSGGNSDMFIATYDDQGNVLWARKGGGVEIDYGSSIAHDRKGNLYVEGTYGDMAMFDTCQINSHGDADIFIASYDSSGNVRFAKTIGGPDNDRGEGIGVDKFGNIYTSGEYWSYVITDTMTTIGQLLLDVFVARYGNYPVCSSHGIITDNISCHNMCDGSVAVNSTGESPFSYVWSTVPPQYSDELINICNGNYHVTVTDAFGCISNSMVSIGAPLPITTNPVVHGTSCTGCSDGSIDLTVTGGNNSYVYQWSNGSINEDVQGLSAGTYSVAILDDVGCSANDTFVVALGTGISEINNSGIFVYPNPVSDQFEIRFRNSTQPENYSSELFNSLGEKVRNLQSGETVVSTLEYSRGIYFLKITDIRSGKTVAILPVVLQ